MKNKNSATRHVFMQVSMFISVIFFTLLIGYCLSAIFWGFDGFLQFIVAIAFGFIVIALTGCIFNFFGKKGGRENFNQMMLNALKQISAGNFDVNIDYGNRGPAPFIELAEQINKVAKDLGTMETLRSEFVSNVSHEIQSPLTSIMGYVAILEKNSLSEKLRMEYLNIIKVESERLSKLSKNLLKLSSLDAGLSVLTKTSFRLDTQIQNVIILFEPQINAKRINLDASLAKVSVVADFDLMQQVLINIIHNAIKFTGEGGNIKIDLKQNNNKAMLKITDNGQGISEQDLPHIFERFFKADKSRAREEGGNGLGLSLVKRIISIHCGTIEVTSELSKGTTFIITL